MVPKDLKNNLKFRRIILDLCKRSPSFRAEVDATCKRDILFYINTFVWTYNPKKVNRTCRPFITWDYQDDLILKIVQKILKQKSLGVLKTREMGATWIVISVFDWFWRFYDALSFGCLSRTEESVDKKGNDNTLFAKFDYIEKRLPEFLQVPGRERSHMHLRNPLNESSIEGASTSPNPFRSGRMTAVLRDEEAAADNGISINASLGFVTDCQLRVSTPQGTGNSFFLARESKIEWVELHFALHPEKRRGLYQVQDGKVEILDKDYKFPSDYNFRDEDGDQLRSIWYDEKADELMSKVLMAQEVDMDFLGSGASPFDYQAIELIVKRDARNPFYKGNFVDGKFKSLGHGQLWLWFHPDSNHQLPPQDTVYSMGIDVGEGTGASDSCISVCNAQTREKIAAFVDNRTLPEDLAELAVNLAKWFSTPEGECLVNWERNGPGSAFGIRVIDRLGYTNVYYHVEKDERKKKKSNKPGWWSDTRHKADLLREYRKAISGGGNDGFVNRCAIALRQCCEYIFTADGQGVEHVKALSSEDPSAKGSRHGDRVIADALCWLGCSQQKMEETDEIAVLPGSMMYRRLQAREAMREKHREWYN